jgi:predicted MFS family arabinose efflux permease
VLALPLLIAFGLTGEVGWLFAFVPLYGATIMVGFPGTSILVARLYGLRAVGVVYGNTQIFHHLAMALGAWSGGAIFDAAGSYYPAFALGAVVSLIAAVGVLAIDERPAPSSHTAVAPTG